MKYTKCRLLIALFLSFSSFGAMAEDGKLYGVFDIGKLNAPDACTGLPATMSCLDTATATRLGLGYQVIKDLGLEASYLFPTKISTSGTYLGFPLNIESTMSGYQLAIIGSIPVTGSFSLFGKLGMAFIDAKTTATSGSTTITTSSNNTNFASGVGLRYSFNDKVAARVMYENFGNVKDSSSNTLSKVTMLSAGIQVGF